MLKTTTWALENLIIPHKYVACYFVENVPYFTTKEMVRFLLKRAGYAVDGYDISGSYFLVPKKDFSSKTKKVYYGYASKEGVEYIDYKKLI